MGKKMKYARNRPYTANLLASFMVLSTSLGITLAAMMIESRDNRPLLIWVVIVVACIALVPFLLVGRPPARAVTPEPSVLRAFLQKFRRSRKGNIEIKPWKRKRTNFNHEPHGQEYVSTFIRERSEPGPPPPPQS